MNMSTPEGAQKLTRLIGTLLLVALTAAAVVLLLLPRVSAPGEIRAQQRSVEEETAKLNDKVAQLEEKVRLLPTLDARIKANQSQIPGEAELPVILREMVSKAKAAGIPDRNIKTLTTNAPTLAGAGDAQGGASLPGVAGSSTMAEMAVQLSVTGGFNQMIQFLSGLEDMDRLYLIDNVSLTEGEGGYTAQITGKMYLLDQAQLDALRAAVDPLVPQVVPGAPAPAATPGAPAPAATPGAPAPAATPAATAEGVPAPAPTATQSGAPAPAPGAGAASPAGSGGAPTVSQQGSGGEITLSQ